MQSTDSFTGSMYGAVQSNFVNLSDDSIGKSYTISMTFPNDPSTADDNESVYLFVHDSGEGQTMSGVSNIVEAGVVAHEIKQGQVAFMNMEVHFHDKVKQVLGGSRLHNVL